MSQFEESIAEPTLADLAEAIKRETMLAVWCSLPARVEEYFPPGDEAVGGGRQPARVRLKISIQRARVIDKESDLKEGETLEEPIGDEEPDRLIALSDYPSIPRAVVMRASCGDSSMRLRGAVAVGTEGTAHFSARSLDRWATRSGQVDPVWTHAHELTDAFFFPEVRGGQAEVDDPAAAGLWSDDGTCGLTFTPDPAASVAALTAKSVELGTAPTQHAARGEQVDANLAALKSAIASVLPVPDDPSASAAIAAIQAAVAAWSAPSTSAPAVLVPAT